MPTAASRDNARDANPARRDPALASRRCRGAHGIADQIVLAGRHAFSAASSQEGAGEAFAAGFFGALAFLAGALATSGFCTSAEAAGGVATGAESTGWEGGIAGALITGAAADAEARTDASTLSRHSISVRVLERL